MLKPKRRPASPWQLVRRLILAMLLIPLLPVMVWWLANRFDQPPSPAAIRLSAPASRTVEDVDNAWLYLTGIGAPAGEDPIVYARRRVATLAARLSQNPVPPADAAEKALFTDAVSHVSADALVDGTAELCPVTVANCIEWAERNEGVLRRLRVANTLRLERYEHLVRMRGWDNLYPPRFETPFPSSSVATLHRTLIAGDLGRAIDAADVAGQVQALARLADVVEFWQRVARHPPELFSVMLASSEIEGAHRLAGDLLERVSLPVDNGLDAQLDRVLQPLEAIDWQRALAFEYKTFVHAISSEMPGLWGVLRRCITRSNADGCLKSLAMVSAFVPQASFNLHAENVEAMRRWIEADATDVERARSVYGAELEAGFVQLDDARVALRQMSYNYSGRVLASIAIPASDWGLRVHDREALRRMLLIKRTALRERVPASAMPDFLAAQPANLRDPYSGRAFEWDGLFREIHFAPEAKEHWKHPRLGVSYSTSRTTSVVDACVPDFDFDVVEGLDDTHASLQFVSCESDVEPEWFITARTERERHRRLAAIRRIYRIDSRRVGNEVGFRMLHTDGKHLRRYETRLTLGEEEVTALLEPVGHSEDAHILVRARDLSQ